MIDDFIGVFDNVISNELCDKLIKVYEDSNKLNFAISRQSMGKEKVKQDNNLVFVTSKLHIKDDIFFEKIHPKSHIYQIFARIECLFSLKDFKHYYHS